MDSPVDSNQGERKQAKNNLTGVLTFIISNGAVFLFSLSILSALIGWGVFRISPLRPLQEIAHRQQQEDLQNRIIKRHFELANLFLNLSKPEAAQSEFENILKLEPYNADAQYGILKAQIMKSIQDKDYDPEATEHRLRLIEKRKPGGSSYTPIQRGCVYKYRFRKGYRIL